MRPSLAQERLALLGIPPTLSDYSREDAERVLQGRAVDPKVRDAVHDKLAWLAGAQVVGHVHAEHPDLRWTTDRFAVRTIDHGEASASFQSFPDGSQVILVSRVLQEILISMANIVEYFDVSTASVRFPRRPRKTARLRSESAARVTGMFRYLVMSQRLTGKPPSTIVELDRRSADIARQLAASALMFVVAHEIGHIALGHADSSAELYDAAKSITVSEVQELQADGFAMNLLGELMAGDPEMVLWSAFIALFARQITETAIYIRRSRKQPRAFARWGVLELRVDEQDDRNETLRIALMAAIGGAMTREDPFATDQWSILWDDPMLSVDPALTPELLARWDWLQTCPLAPLIAEAGQEATGAGTMLLEELRRGDISEALSKLGLKRRAKAEILDRSLPLSFFALKNAIETAPSPFTAGDSLVFVMAGARLAAEHLKGDHIDDW